MILIRVTRAFVSEGALETPALAALAAIPGLSCTYSVSVPAIPANGGYVYVTVNTQAGCAWELSRSGSFLGYYSGRTGTGPGTVILYAEPDPGAARSATVGVAARPVQRRGVRRDTTRTECLPWSPQPGEEFRVAATMTCGHECSNYRRGTRSRHPGYLRRLKGPESFQKSRAVLKVPGLQDVPYSSLYSSPINKADSVFDNQYSEP
jgi:hypothetical protein